MNDTDLELAQLLCTRLCHDLAGPVGAVAAGVELIGGDPSQADAETLGLIGNSSAAASLKLKFLRTVLGGSGASGDPKALLDGYLDAVAGPTGKPAVTWPSAEDLADGSTALGPRWMQTLLNLCLLALETQPSTRTLSLQIMRSPDFTILVEVRGPEGRVAAVREDLLAAIAGRVPPALTAKIVHGNFAGRLVRAAGGSIDLAPSGNGVTVTAKFPKNAGPPS